MVRQPATCLGSLKPAPFSQAAHKLREYGLCPIPVGGDGDKVPLVKGWTRSQRVPSFKTLAKWIEQYPDANIGIGCGLSGVTIIDIDDPSLVTDMIQRFGDTPLITLTPSGGVHLWFKSSRERNASLRSYELDVDVRGVGGMAVVPPSIRRSGAHVGKPYRIIKGCWDDLARLPRLRPGSLVFNTGLVSATSKGRNDALFKYLLGQVRHCDDFDALLDIARARNSEFREPLPDQEVEKTARSAFDYENNPEKENWVGGPPRVVVTAGEGGELSILQKNADACVLYLTLKENHGGREEPFCISPKAMAAAGVIPAFKKSHNRYRKARDSLVKERLIIQIHRGKGRAWRDGELVSDPHSFAFPS